MYSARAYKRWHTNSAISVVKPKAQWDCRLAFCEAKRMFPLSYGVPRTFYTKTIPESPYEYLSDIIVRQKIHKLSFLSTHHITVHFTHILKKWIEAKSSRRSHCTRYTLLIIVTGNIHFHSSKPRFAGKGRKVSLPSLTTLECITHATDFISV